MSLLVLVRHGESRWNVDGRFSGWVDIPLSENGVREAERCARHCRDFRFNHAFTSRLGRAHETLQIILSAQGRTGVIQHQGIDTRYAGWIKHSNKLQNNDLPIHTSEILNERYYGLLQGLKKSDAERRYGAARVLEWRRGYAARPPRGESLQDAFQRIIPFFQRRIFPLVHRGEQVLVTAHGNTLRAAVKYIEGISDEAIADIDFPEAQPIAYQHAKHGWQRIAGEYRHGRPLR